MIMTPCTCALIHAHAASSFLPAELSWHSQAGQGSKMKLVLNMIMGTMMASLAECITLAQA